MRAGQPDPEDLAALTGRPAKLPKAAPVDPVLGLVRQPAAPAPGQAAQGARVMHPVPPAPATQTPADRPAQPPAAPKKEKLGGYYMHRADLERAQAAHMYSKLAEGGQTWSDFQVEAVMRLTEERERKHNGGRPFPPLPPGTRVS